MSRSPQKKAPSKHNGVTMTFQETGDTNDWWKFVQGVQSSEYYDMDEPKASQSSYFAEYLGDNVWREIFRAFDELKTILRNNDFEVTVEVSPDKCTNKYNPVADIHVEKKKKVA